MDKQPFQPAMVGGIDFRNRFVRSATYEGISKKGRPGEAYFNQYEALAKGGVGLIITGYFAFSKTDNPLGVIPQLGDDSFIPDLQKLTGLVHAAGGKIMPQLNHASSLLFHQPRGDVYGPSAVAEPVNGITPIPFTREQIQELVDEFSEAAFRAKSAGFDGVQLHGAHGYLLSKFLSPVFNKRTDEYGGDIKGRTAVIVAVLHAIKKRCGSNFPVWIKLNCSDFAPGDSGLTEKDFLAASGILSEAGIDAIEVSGGSVTGQYQPSRSFKHEAYHLDAAIKLTEQVKTPVIPVGGFRRLAAIEEILTTTAIQAVSLSRPLIREPGLIKRWEEGKREDATCIACSGCYNPEGTTCFQELSGAPKERQKAVNAFMRSLQAKEK